MPPNPVSDSSKYWILGGVVLVLAAVVWVRGKGTTSATNFSGTSYSPSDLVNATSAQTENAFNYDSTTGQWTGNGESDPYYSFFEPSPVFTSTSSAPTPNEVNVNQALLNPVAPQIYQG